MVLAEIQAKQSKQSDIIQTLSEALTFYTAVANDFEVQINFRLKPWLEAALQQAQQGQLDKIQAYQFAY